MTQPIKIQLTSDAISALFPEGTQARVELQNAVVAEFVRKHIREAALGSNIQDQVERARTDAYAAVKSAKDTVIAQVLKDYGIEKPHYYGRAELKQETKDIINTAVRQAIRDEISTAVAEHVKVAAEKLQGTVSHAAQVAVNRMVDSEIRAAVKARVAAVTEQLLKS